MMFIIQSKMQKALDKKYKTEDANMKKFIVSKFLDFKMVCFKDHNKSSSRVSIHLA